MNCFIFDVDGTLIDTEYGHMEGLRRTLIEQCGKEYSYEEIRKFFGIPRKETLETLGVDDRDGSFNKRWWELFEELSQGKVEMFDGIRDVLDILKSRGILMGVVTSQKGTALEQTFKEHNLEGYFPISVHANMTELHKPHSDPLNKYFELVDIPKDKAVYIGDSKHDWMCAKSAGVKFCLAGWGCSDPKEIMPNYYLRKPVGLLNLL